MRREEEGEEGGPQTLFCSGLEWSRSSAVSSAALMMEVAKEFIIEKMKAKPNDA
jgi:hypothetical protein